VIEHAHPKEVRQELAYTNFGDGITKARLQELWTFNHNCWRNTQSQRDDGDVGTHVCAVHPSLQNTPCNKLSWPTNYLRNYRITSLAIPFMSPPKNKKKDNKEKKITTN
jgi:hypothetical protein